MSEQLAALAELCSLLERNGIAYWLFGGWAVDFHVGRITRPHTDLDVAVWASDLPTVAALLRAQLWEHEPDEGEDGYTGYRRGGVRLEIALLATDTDGHAFTPLRVGRAAWPPGSFGAEIRELRGVRSRVISRAPLMAEKSIVREDPLVAAKDRADLLHLLALSA
jgi:hypothetical protein